MTESWAWVTGGIIFSLMVIIMMGERNTDSIHNCAASCEGKMGSYTETPMQVSAPVGIRTLMIPVCVCK